MPKAIRIYETGGPEVMRWEDVEVREPGAGKARIRHTAVGVNYDVPRKGGRDGPVPCRRRRGRADRLPVAEGPRGDRDRHGRLRPEGGDRQSPRVRARDRLHPGGHPISYYQPSEPIL
jgi:hypothetical protein